MTGKKLWIKHEKGQSDAFSLSSSLGLLGWMDRQIWKLIMIKVKLLSFNSFISKSV